MRVDFRKLRCASALRGLKAAMYESSCSYAGALELKRSALKEEPWPATEWPPYRLHQSTFEQLKQSVEKAKAALQDRSGLLGTATAFGEFYGGQLGQDAAGTTLGFGRTRNEDMLGTMEKAKSVGSDKLSGSLSKGYSTPSLSDTLRATKCADMANKEYYERWLKLKKLMTVAVAEDSRLHELATKLVGIKPQGTAVELVARTYGKYCDLYNKLCDCYDQMQQAQRRSYIKKIIDAVTCRILELKSTLEEVEVFEFTYPDNALQQMLMTPDDIKILCPFFYPFEIRQQEMQYIIDEIFAGNRLGDPEPTPSELERIEEARLEEERIKKEQRDAEIMRKLALGEDIGDSTGEPELSPKELEELRLREEYQNHVSNIQRMQRSSVAMKDIFQKKHKDNNLYLELAGLKLPQSKEVYRERASLMIMRVYRMFMKLKRAHNTDNRLKNKLGMIFPSSKPESAKVQLEKVKEARRNFRQKYHEEWMKKNVTEKARVFRLREGDIMEDISAEIRQWFQEWYQEVRLFDEFPYPEEGGSILVVTGNTFTIEEFELWREAEQKRLKAEAGNPKSKEQIKAEKAFERAEKKRIAMEAREKEKKRLKDYKKMRLNPDADPGIYLKIGHHFQPVLDSWNAYESQWKSIDAPDAPLNVIKGYIMQLITENCYHDIQLQLRPIVDEMMRLELKQLQNSLKIDCLNAGLKAAPQSRKRKKPKKVKPPKPEKVPPERMFQRLVDGGIIRQYPKRTLDDYWGERNYAAADMRAIPWTPSFPPPCLGDVKEQVRIRCLLTLGSRCSHIHRTQLLVGPKSAGKRTLVYAIATEANAILIDLSPMNVYNKFPGPKQMKIMIHYVNKISRIMQPSIILLEDVEKLYYKRVPKEEKAFDPTRLQKVLHKDIVKHLGKEDRVLVLGTSALPWLAKAAMMRKVFPSTILLPKSDYGSISFILSKILMQYHGVDREFDVHSVAQALRGYDVNTIRKAVEGLLNGERIKKLYYKPLQPIEILNAVLACEGSGVDDAELQMFKDWYHSYSPWGEKYADYMIMLDSQYAMKLKQDKKKKKAPQT